MEFNNSRHYQALVAGLFIFGLILPLSKSISSILMAVIYGYSSVTAFYNKDFRTTLISNIVQPLNIPIGVYILIAVSGLLFSENLPDGIGVIKQIANLFLVYLMVSALINVEQNGDRRFKNAGYLLLFFLAGIFLLDLLGLLTYLGFIGNKKYVLPLHPLNMHHIWFGNLNAIGLYIAASLLLFSFQGKLSFRSIFLWSFILLAAISVLLSTARTAWLGILFTAIIFVYFFFKNKKVFFIAGVLIIVGCVFLYLLNTIVHDRINKIVSDVSLFISGITTTSIGTRFLMWKAAIEMFLSHPILGVGTGDYRTALSQLVAAGRFPDFILNFNQPHNMYLFTMATNGLVGLFALFFIFFSIFKYAGSLIHLLRRERIFGFIALAVAVHFMIAGLTESLLNIHILICTFALVMGVSVRRSKIE